MHPNPFDIIHPADRWRPHSREQQNSIAPLV